MNLFYETFGFLAVTVTALYFLICPVFSARQTGRKSYSGASWFLLGLILVLGSCETERYSVSITNESSKIVRFSYDGSIENLDPSKSKVYSVEAYTQPPVFLETIPKGPRSIGMKNGGDVYEFIDLDEIALNVFNKLPFDIEISAGDFIDGGSNKTYVVVPANTTNNTGSIYTSNPKFTVVPQGYSAQVTYTITDNTMYVEVK